jgi:hypothetical protein
MARKLPPLAAMLWVIALGTAPATGHTHPPSRLDERLLQRFERELLGPRHAAEHAVERRALRRARADWRRRPASERRRLRTRAATAATQARAAADAPADEVGRWVAQRVAFPTYAINTVLLPTGKVLFWGRSPLDRGTGERVNDTPAYVWDPAKGAQGFTAVRPPAIDIDGDSDLEEAPLFCSGQSLLPSGEVLATGGTLEYPVYAGDGSTVSDFKGLDRAFTFDPWTLGWREQPRMRKGRWYPTQAMLADGRIAILAGWDETGAGAASDNPDLEVFTPAAVRGGRGTMTRYSTGQRAGVSYYPHLFTMPDGRLLLGGAEPDESALLDPARLSAAGPSAWTELPPLQAQYRYSASAVLLPAGPAGSSRVAILGGLVDEGGAVNARRDADVIDTRSAAPAWRRDDAVVPPLNRGRDYFNLVLLPDGSLASLGGAAGVRKSGGPPPPQNSYTGGDQTLKQVELLPPGGTTWRLGPPQRKWRTYHSTALLLPDGRVLSAGDDYWDLGDRPDPYIREGSTAGKPLDEAELYEPPYLFDGSARAPRPVITGGPASAAWGDDLGVPVAEAGGRQASRAVLVAPGAVTHGVDMNQRHVELSVLGRVDGKGLNVRMPASPNLAPPGWYMLFVLDATGTPSVARWVQLRAGAPDTPTLGADAPAAPQTPAAPSAPPAPPDLRADTRGPRATVRAGRVRRGARTVRLAFRADEPARLTASIRIGRRVVRSRLRLTATRPQGSVTLRLRTAERKRLARKRRLVLAITLVARDTHGNVSRRSLRVRVLLRGARTG